MELKQLLKSQDIVETLVCEKYENGTFDAERDPLTAYLIQSWERANSGENTDTDAMVNDIDYAISMLNRARKSIVQFEQEQKQ